MDHSTAPAPQELREATDEEIERNVAHADPMVLRGLLFQLTGDARVAWGKLTEPAPPTPATLAREQDAEFLRSEASRLLKTYRDSGVVPTDIGPKERLPRSLALTAGVGELDDEDVPLWLEELALDPWVRGLQWDSRPPHERLDDFLVIVIGAGMGGISAAAQLQRAGIRYIVMEKNSGVGGTWFENRYPGARVDSPSRAYSHIFGVEYIQPYGWCPQEENERYFNWVVDRFQLRDHIAFDTEVVSLSWDEQAALWTVVAKGPEGQRLWPANAVISAVGLLSRPCVPKIPGAEDFEGLSVHTARWPLDLRLEDKRVAVIGTGCSGTQLVPELALQAGHVTVCQRTPQWLFEHRGYLSRLAPEVLWLDRIFPFHVNFTRFRAHWLLGPDLSRPLREMDPTFEDPFAPSAIHKKVRDQRIEFIRHKFRTRPDLFEKMIPPHPPFATRPVQVDADYCYYDALLRDNVTLVTEGISQIMPKGIRTIDGADHPVDVIVYATGFRANECLWPMVVTGRRGRTIGELWSKDGPRAYLGVMLPGFPNFFMIYGPNMNPYGGLGVINLEEIATRYIMSCLQRLIVEEIGSVEVIDEAYWQWNERLDEREKFKIYKDRRARSYYTNEHGRSATNCPFPGDEIWHELRHPRWGDMILR